MGRHQRGSKRWKKRHAHSGGGTVVSQSDPLEYIRATSAGARKGCSGGRREIINIDPPRTQMELRRFVEDTMQLGQLYAVPDKEYPYKSMKLRSVDDGKGGEEYYWTLVSREGDTVFPRSDGVDIKTYKSLGWARRSLIKKLQWTCE